MGGRRFFTYSIRKRTALSGTWSISPTRSSLKRFRSYRVRPRRSTWMAMIRCSGCSGGRGQQEGRGPRRPRPDSVRRDRSASGSVVSVLLVVLGLEGLLGLAGAGGGSGDGELGVEEHVRSFRWFLPVPGPERENARSTGAPLSCVARRIYRGAGKAVFYIRQTINHLRRT